MSVRGFIGHSALLFVVHWYHTRIRKGLHMKRALRSAAGVLALCCAMILVSRVSARQDAPQVPWRQYAGDYTQIENVLNELYKSVSFGPGDECDWERIRMLCHPYKCNQGRVRHSGQKGASVFDSQGE